MIHYPQAWPGHSKFTGVGALVAVALLALVAAAFVGSPFVPTAATALVQPLDASSVTSLLPEPLQGHLLPPVPADAEAAQPVDTF